MIKIDEVIISCLERATTEGMLPTIVEKTGISYTTLGRWKEKKGGKISEENYEKLFPHICGFEDFPQDNPSYWPRDKLEQIVIENSDILDLKIGSGVIGDYIRSSTSSQDQDDVSKSIENFGQFLNLFYNRDLFEEFRVKAGNYSVGQGLFELELDINPLTIAPGETLTISYYIVNKSRHTFPAWLGFDLLQENAPDDTTIKQNEKLYQKKQRLYSELEDLEVMINPVPRVFKRDYKIYEKANAGKYNAYGALWFGTKAHYTHAIRLSVTKYKKLITIT